MRILIACEFSGVVRDAFNSLGFHTVVSCDLLPCESKIAGLHYQGKVEDILYDGWDLMIAHPPCTYLSVSGARWWKNRLREQTQAIEFVQLLLDAPIQSIALENPVGILSTIIKKPDQIIQPWQFGHGETKRTCLWLKNLQRLKPTKTVFGRKQKIHLMGPSNDRGKKRSVTYSGIADAMAQQWGKR